MKIHPRLGPEKNADSSSPHPWLSLEEVAVMTPNAGSLCTRKSLLSLDFSQIKKNQLSIARLHSDDNNNNNNNVSKSNYNNISYNYSINKAITGDTNVYEISKRPESFRSSADSNNVDQNGYNLSTTNPHDQHNISFGSKDGDQPIVLASPDIDMLKLSTPDLDDYFIQLQHELSLPTTVYPSGDNNDSCTTPSPDCETLNTPKVQMMDSSDFRKTLPILTGEDPSKVTTTTTGTTASLANKTVHHESSWPADLIAGSTKKTNSRHLAQDVLDLADQVSIVTRFSSFDSGFSDISVKTEIESELEDSENDGQARWSSLEKLKLDSFPHLSSCVETDKNSSCYKNDSNKQYNNSTRFDAFDMSRYQKIPLNPELPSYSFSDGSIGHIDLCNGQRQPHHHEHLFQNHHNYSNEQHRGAHENYRSRYEVCFSVSDKEMYNISSNTKKSIKKERPFPYEPAYGSLDSSTGGLCSEHSSFDDEKETPCLQNNPTHSNALTGSFLPVAQRTKYYPDKQFGCVNENNLEQSFGFSFPSRNTGRESGRVTTQAKRKCLKRQNAETKFDHLEGTTMENQTFKQHYSLDDYSFPTLSSEIVKLEPASYVANEARHWAGSAAARPIDMVEQELIKLERKRARNRLAATRCRNRKLERIHFLKAEVEFLKDLNFRYVDRVRHLRQEIDRLKCDVTLHVTNGCDLTCLLGVLR